jgi:origin recognition complex subunit 1
MPHITEQSSVRQRVSKAERARRYLTGGAVCREDSDDELGLEDHPWEWIYNDQGGQTVEQASDSTVDNSRCTTGFLHSAPKGQKRASNGAVHEKAIVGARMGNFECKIGDCVLLKADGTKEAWVGLICEFMEDEEEGMVANFMWFSTEKEIRNKEKKRKDFMQVCCPTQITPFATKLIH